MRLALLLLAGAWLVSAQGSCSTDADCPYDGHCYAELYGYYFNICSEANRQLDGGSCTRNSDCYVGTSIRLVPLLPSMSSSG